MNDDTELKFKLSNFKSPLEIVPSFKSQEQPSSPRITLPDDNQTELSKEKPIQNEINLDEPSSSSPLVIPNQKEPEQLNAFQRLSQFRFDQMFPRKPMVSYEQRPFRLRAKQARCLSTERSTSRNLPNQKLVNIEERLKKINVFLKNEFLETKKYLKLPAGLSDLKLPAGLSDLKLPAGFSDLKLPAGLSDLKLPAGLSDLKLPTGLSEETKEKLFFFRRPLRERPVIRKENIDSKAFEEMKTEDIERKEEEIPETCEISTGLGTITLRNVQMQEEEIGNSIALNLAEASAEDSILIQKSSFQDASINLGPETDTSVAQNTIQREEAPNVNANFIQEPSRTESGVPNEIQGTDDTRNEDASENGEPHMDNLNVILDREAHFRLRRTFVTFLAVFFCSMFLSMMFENGYTYRPLFISLYGFLIYYLVEGCNKIFSEEVIAWKRIENLFNTFDIVSVIFFLVVVDLKMNGIISSTSFAIFLPLSSSSLYYFFSKAPKSVLDSQLLTKILFSLQIYLITAKIDGSIEWHWKTVVALVWIYLAMGVVYFILLTFMMVLMVILSFFNISLYQNMNKRTQVVGFFWYLCYIGLGPLLFTAMIGVCDAYDHKHDFTLFNNCITFAKYFSIAAMALTEIACPTLITFLQKFNIDEPEFRIQIGSPDSRTMTKIEVEKRDIYLVMLSSTYFLPLKQSFFHKSKENLKRCKRALTGSRNRGQRKAYTKGVEVAKRKVQSQQEEPISIATLKKEKEELEKKFEKQNLEVPKGSKKVQKKEMTRDRSFHFLNFPPDWETTKQDELLISPTNLKYKGDCFSEGDKDYIASLESFENLEADADAMRSIEKKIDMCYICCEKVPNAVIMACGHGGICYDCAIKFVKDKNQCMECRGPIENVVKINPTPRMRNIIRGYETSKLIGFEKDEDIF